MDGLEKDIINSAFKRHLDVVNSVLQTISSDIEKGAILLRDTVASGNKVLFCGNGGSAADSQHFAAELTGHYLKERAPLAGIALTVDTSAMTAIGNDYSFEQVFARQVNALGNPGDLLIAFSTSGRSANVLRATQAARARKMKVIFMTGAGGGETVEREGFDVSIIVPSKETARVQEVHEVVYHAWCEYLDSAL